jgi:hypothetical protein
MTGGLQGALSAGIFFGAGEAIQAGQLGLEASVTVHGVAGCVSSVAGGGKCGPGALSAAFSKTMVKTGFTKAADPVEGTIKSAIAGGIGSVLGGGKFANGAQTGAFSYLYNECMHTRMCGSDSTKEVNMTGNVAASPAGYITMLGGSDPSIHLGFEIIDGYGSYRIDGAPSYPCLSLCDPDLVGRWGGAEGGPILFRDKMLPQNGMSLGGLANQIRAEASDLQGRFKYTYPNLRTGYMGPAEYNSNSFFSTIYLRTMGDLPPLQNKSGFIYPGANNLIAPRR